MCHHLEISDRTGFPIYIDEIKYQVMIFVFHFNNEIANMSDDSHRIC